VSEVSPQLRDLGTDYKTNHCSFPLTSFLDLLHKCK
jgi:hypothetical protein